MAENTAVVRVVNSHAEAIATIEELQRRGFDIDTVSIVGKDYKSEPQGVPAPNVYDRMQDWQKLSALWGNLWGLLSRSAFFFIPGIGPVIICGPLTGWIIQARNDSGMVDGLSALGAGLFSIGIPKNSITEYERSLQSDKFIVIARDGADGTPRTNTGLETPGATRSLPAKIERRLMA